MDKALSGTEPSPKGFTFSPPKHQHDCDADTANGVLSTFVRIRTDMNPNRQDWYSAPEVVPDTGLHPVKYSQTPESIPDTGFCSVKYSQTPESVPGTGLHPVRYSQTFPEAVNSSAASTTNLKTEQWSVHPDQLEQNSVERRSEGGNPQDRFLDAQHSGEHDGPRKADTRKYVCGLRTGLFWIVLIVITVVIVGAAVGVGVGVSLAQRSQSAEGSAEGSAEESTGSSTSFVSPATTSPVSTSLSSSSSSIPTTTTIQSSSVTTTSIVGPSSTLYRDCPSSDKEIYDVTLGSKSYSYRKFCSTVLMTISTKSNDNLLAEDTTDLNGCINKCALYNDENSSGIANGERPWCVLSLCLSVFQITGELR